MALKIDGFEPASGEVMPRLIMSIEALEKNGKTHFALTAPGPIAYFDFDIGTEGVINKFTAGKEIIVSEHRIPRDSDGGKGFDFARGYETFHKRFMAALNNKQVRTLIVDTMSEAWELLRMARFGKLTQVMPRQYGPVNAEVRELIRQCFEHDKNVILVHKMKPQYVGDIWKGTYERAGFKDIGFLVQVNGQLGFDEGEFTCHITDCRQDMSLSGMDLAGPLCNFPILAQMVFPTVDPERWG